MLNTDTEGVASVISHDRVTISCSDAGAHNIFLCDADFGLQVLGTWVRDRGLFSMEQAVHEVTGKVAAIYGLQERGTLEVASPRPFGAFCLCLGLHCYPVLLQMWARECSLKPEICGLQVGNWADLLLFDPATINSTPTERVADLPAGASRLTRRSVGVFGTCRPCAKPFLVWMASRQCELSCCKAPAWAGGAHPAPSRACRGERPASDRERRARGRRGRGCAARCRHAAIQRAALSGGPATAPRYSYA